MRRALLSLGLLLSLAAVGAPAAAQTGYSIEPFAGYYRPLGHFDPAPVDASDLPETPSGLSGVLWGGNAQMTFSSRLAVEGMASTAASTVPGCNCPDGVLPPTPARVTLAALKGQYDLSNDPSRYQLWVGAGPAMIRHGGKSYQPYGSPTSWGGAVGLELSASVATHVQLVGSASGVAYSFSTAAAFQHGPQFDALLSVGLRWHSGP